MEENKHKGKCMMKLALISFIFVVVNLWDGLANWIQTTNVWWFVVAFVVFAILSGGCGNHCGRGSGSMAKPVAQKKTARKKKK